MEWILRCVTRGEEDIDREVLTAKGKPGNGANAFVNASAAKANPAFPRMVKDPPIWVRKLKDEGGVPNNLSLAF
jgi:hypothetical protein